MNFHKKKSDIDPENKNKNNTLVTRFWMRVRMIESEIAEWVRIIEWVEMHEWLRETNEILREDLLACKWSEHVCLKVRETN